MHAPISVSGCFLESANGTERRGAMEVREGRFGFAR